MKPGRGLPGEDPGLQGLPWRRRNEGHEISRGGNDALPELRLTDHGFKRIAAAGSAGKLRHDHRRHEVEGHQLAVDVVEGSAGGGAGVFEHHPPGEIVALGQVPQALPDKLP